MAETTNVLGSLRTEFLEAAEKWPHLSQKMILIDRRSLRGLPSEPDAASVTRLLLPLQDAIVSAEKITVDATAAYSFFYQADQPSSAIEPGKLALREFMRLATLTAPQVPLTYLRSSPPPEFNFGFLTIAKHDEKGSVVESYCNDEHLEHRFLKHLHATFCPEFEIRTFTFQMGETAHSIDFQIRSIKHIFRTSATAVQMATPKVDSTEPKLRVDLAQCHVWIDNVGYPVSPNAATIIAALIEARGEWVSVSDMENVRPRDLNGLPPEVNAAIERPRGKGSRIRREYLST